MVTVLAVADTVQIATIVGAAALLQTIVSGVQTKRGKQEDYRRQNEVAAAAEKARVALIEENKRRDEEAARQQKAIADEAARQQEQVAAVARGAAELLREAQEATKSDADEVARVAAEKAASPVLAQRSRLLAVVISHPSGVQRTIELKGIPSEGQHLLLRGDSRPMRVADNGILWVEANGGDSPSVIVVVCPIKPGEELGHDALRAARHADDKHEDM